MADSKGVQTAILAGVWATFALDVFSTLNSSPQTTELFAGDREDTLMHWVVIGDAAALGGGLIGTLFSGSPWPLVATAAIVLKITRVAIATTRPFSRVFSTTA